MEQKKMRYSPFESLFTLDEDTRPLDYVVTDGGLCSIFQSLTVIGDSLSSGEFESVDEDGKHSWHDMYEYAWGSYMARDCGFHVNLFSKGGMKASTYMESFANERGFFDPKYRSQMYIIALGVNDMWSDIPMGSVGDIDLCDLTKNAKTYAGYYAQIIQKYKEISPDAFFFLVTMPRLGDAHDSRRAEYAQLLNDIAGLFGQVYVIDLYKYAPVYDAAFKERFWLHGHMNPMGYRYTALMMESYIDYYIRKDPPAFYEIGFMGTNYYTLGDKAKNKKEKIES